MANHHQKKGYTTRGAATRAAARSALKSGYPIRIYPCGECHKLHLTKEVRKKRR